MTPLSYVEIDGDAIRGNYQALSDMCPQCEVFAVVKANAYGHGMEEVVAALDGQSKGFAVDDVEELARCRRLTDARIMVLGYVQSTEAATAIELGGELVVYDTARLGEIAATARRKGLRAPIHLKVDALLGRQGLMPDEVSAFSEALQRFPEIELRSVYSHFANIEDTTDLTHALSQREAFQKAFDLISAKISSVARHESATSGLMSVENSRTPNTIVRVGIGLYGLYPSSQLERTSGGLALKPALRWVSHLAQVKELPAGHPVGYGLTYITSRPTKIGIVPQGYSDGYDRGLSNAGHVLIRGMSCSVLGRIAMNMFAVDVSHVPDVRAEEEVVLLGTQSGGKITAEELALKTNTINYEVVARISPLLPRLVKHAN